MSQEVSLYPVDVGEDEAAARHDLQQALLAAEAEHLCRVLVQARTVHQRQRLPPQRRPEVHQAGIVDLFCAGLPKEQQRLAVGASAELIVLSLCALRLLWISHTC